MQLSRDWRMPTTKARFLYAAMLLMGTVQFVWFYLSKVRSELHLEAFEAGLERTPFQYRLLLAGPLRWAHNSHLMNTWAASISVLPGWFPHKVHAEGLLEAGLDLLSVGIACAAAQMLYRRTSRLLLLPWLVSPLLLVLCAVTFIGQTHHALRFVYDLPSMAFFAAGLCAIYADRRLYLFLLFAVATVNRETTLLLLPFLFLADRQRAVPLRRTLALAGPLLGYWILVHLWVVHRFAANPSAAGPRFWLNVGSLLIPLYWPQVAGALGYLGPFLILYRRSIPDPVLRVWLHGLWFWFAAMVVFGLLVETRLCGELLPYTACIASLMAEEKLAARLLPKLSAQESESKSVTLVPT